MTNKYHLTVPVILLAVMTTLVPAQEKKIPGKEFGRVEKKAKDFFKTTSYRLTRTTESPAHNKKEPYEVTRRIEEHVPPDRIRLLFEVEDTDNAKSLKNEWVTIGKNHFSRDNDGPWIKSLKDERPHPSYTLLKREYFSDASIVVDGKKVDVFVIIERTKTDVIRAPLVVLGIQKGKVQFKTSEIICVDKQTHGYDTEGRRIKLLGEVHCEEKGRSDDDYHYVEIYEYDPNIKIEAPIK